MKLNQNAKSMLAMMALAGAIIVALNAVILPAGASDMLPLSLGLLALAILFWIWIRGDASAETSDDSLQAAEEAAAEAEALAKRREVRRDVQPAASVERDDFTILWGIGPDYQSVLYAANIRTYADLAAMSADELEDIFPGRMPSHMSSLPARAELAARGDWDGLRECQDAI